IQAIPDLVYFKDVKGRNLLFNKAFESFIGMDARQIAGKRDSEIMPGKLALQCRKSDQEVLTHKKTVRIEEYFALPGGEQQYFETIKSPIFDEQKKLNGLIGISRDINNRKKAEKELNFRLEYQKLLSRISTNFTKLRWNNIDDEIEDAIEHVCSFLKVEFGGIYMFSEDQSVVRIKYEWADPGIDLEKSRYLEWHTVRFPEIMSKISLHKTFYTSSPEELSPGLASVKKESEIDFKTLLVEPLFSGKNKLLGVLVFVQISHEKKWTEDEISFIQIFGEMVINLIERQQSEQQLGNIQAILKAAIEQSPAGIIIADAPDVRIRIANQAALGIRGETEDLLTKIPIQHHPERWKVYKEDGQLCSGEELPLSRAILNGEVCSDEEYIIRRESGEDRWVSANSAPIRNSEGKIVAGIVVFPDITERKRAESLLQVLNSASLAMQKAMTREEILKAIGNEFELLHFNCMIFLLDENEKFMNASLLSFGDTAIRKMERLLGMNQQEFSIPVQDLEIYRKVIVQRETVFIEDPEKELIHFLPGKTKKLTRRLIEILGLTRTIAAPLIISDRVVGAISVQSVNLMPSYIPAINAFAHQIAAAWHKANLMESLTDSMAELKHTQEQLIQAQKMEAVGKLAGGIAHDFNNLLTVIQGYSEILLNQLNKSDKAYYNVLQIEKAGRSAESLVRQLLAFGRKQIMNTKILNINNKLRDLQPMLERLIGESVELIILPASEIGNVKVDPNQLEQVIMNLVVNAKDAMPDGGTIIIETMNVTLPDEYAKQMYTEIYPGRYVLMTISDNGCGMDEDTQSQIFEPFFTTKVKGKGTGLGLSTVYGIIKQSGGYIVVKSQPNQGSTFRIYLPRVDTIKGKGFVDVSRKSDKERGYETILLVEDEKDVRSIIADTLRTRGYRVLEAPNGEVAIEMCKQNINSIDLILTDVVMPKIDGVVMVSRIQSLQPDIKVIYMSGYTDEEIIQHGILREGVHFLQKPFVPAFLLHKVRDVLDEYEE
ncbi:MAG: PAS domain S-box protein, partial [Calditrichaeota bacterium]